VFKQILTNILDVFFIYLFYLFPYIYTLYLITKLYHTRLNEVNILSRISLLIDILSHDIASLLKQSSNLVNRQIM